MPLGGNSSSLPSTPLATNLLKREIAKSADEQLSDIGRRLHWLNNEKTGFFRSIALQLNDPALDAQSLRHLIYNTVQKRPYQYLHLVPEMSKVQLETELKHLRNVEEWLPKMQRVALSVLAETLNITLVVIKNYSSPQYYSHGSQGADHRMVVIVADSNDECYHSTKLLSEDSKLKETDDGIINRPAMKHVGQPPQYHQSQRMSGRKQNSSSSQSSSFSQKLQQREIIPNSTLNSEDADYNEIVPFDALPTKTRTSTSFSQRFKSFFQTAKSKLNRKTDKKDTFGVENPKPPTDDPDIAILCGYSELESESFHQAKDSVVLPSGKQLQQRNRLPTPTLSEDGLPCITSNNLPLNVQGKPKCLLEGSEIFQKDFLPTTSFAHTISNSSHCLHSFEKVSLVKHSTDNNCASHQNCSANSEYQVAVQPSVMSNSAQYSYLKIPTNSADETYSRPRKISRQHSSMPKTVYNSLSAAAAAGFVPGSQSKHPNNESSHIYCQLHPSTFARSPSSTAGRINHLNEIFHSPFDQSDQPNVIFSSHPRPLGSPLTEEQHSAARLSYQPITAHTPNQSRSHLEDLNAKHIKRTPDQSNRLVPFSLLSARTKSDNRSNKSPRRFSMPWSFPPIYSNDNCTSDQSNQFSNTPPLSLLSVQPEYDIRSAENHLQMTQPTGDRSSNLSTRRFTVPWIVSQKPSKISRPSDTLIPPPNISYYIAPSAQPMSNNRSNQSPRRFSIPWPLSPIHSNIHTPEESNHTFDKPSSSTHSTQ